MYTFGGSSLVIQWLGLGTFTAVGLGSIPGQGTKILQAAMREEILNTYQKIIYSFKKQQNP